MHLHFAEPRWLWAGAVACLALATLYVRAGRRRRRAVALLAGARAVTSLSTARRRGKAALLLLGTASLFVALARPLAGFRWEETRSRGIDLMFAVDTSKSMLATDLRPDRLTRAKLAVRDLVRALPGERFGLIAFAGDAFVQAPMTTDASVFEESLDALDTTVIPRGGTDLASAIRTAVVAMSSEPDRRKVLILLSDGEDLAGQAGAAAAEARAKGLTIYTVGVGTAAGELIAARDEAGRPVRSRLDESTLAAVARATGGAYVALGPSGQGLQALYRTELAKLPRSTTAERRRKVYTERFQIPLAVALGCLLAELAIGERRRGRWRPATAAVALAVFGWAAAAQAGGAPDVASYNAGTGAYRQRDYAAAQQRFQAATRAGDLGVQANAYYDLGNAHYRVGQATEKQNPAATIDAWKGALAAYDGALALNQADADARFNRDLVARKLAALQQQQEQQQQQQQQQKQEKGSQQQKQEQQQGSGQRQQQPRQGPPKQAGQGGGAQKPSPQEQGPQPSPAQGGGQGQPQNTPAAGHPQPAQAAPRGAGAPTAAADGQRPDEKEGQPGERAGDLRKQPGGLSRAEADQLLDSLDGQMQRLPMAAFGKRPTADDQPVKDW
ncbi:MAG TPA: VWA domain-containing protein [Polyangia bacterium]|nr:VWA domain-containing protein [Polyangia bacterium]